MRFPMIGNHIATEELCLYLIMHWGDARRAFSELLTMNYSIIIQAQLHSKTQRNFMFQDYMNLLTVASSLFICLILTVPHMHSF